MMKNLKKIVAMALFALATGLVYAQPTKRFTAFTVPTNATTIANYTNGNLYGNYTLSADTTYILDVIAFVGNGHTLTIEPGAVIKAELGVPGEANSVVVARGGKIMANGTKEKPIIFTTVEDPLDGTYSATNRAKWGGIILLGAAYNNILYLDPNPENASFPLGVANGEGYIEGLNPPDPRNRYGAATRTGDALTGTPNFVDNDNSGVLRYVSVRHGGSTLGANNEINGVTFGSVGSNTVVEYVEVVSNEDDGMEFFGGTVNVKYINIMFCEDDQIDTDQGYRGKGQFIYCVQLPLTSGAVATTLGDNGFEWDGNDVDGRHIASNPHFSNVTVIGHAGTGDYGLELKEDIAGQISCGIFAGFDIAGRHKGSSTDIDTTKLVDILFLNCGAAATFNPAYLNNVTFLNSTTVIDDILSITTILSGSIYTQTVTDQLNPIPAVGTENLECPSAPWEKDSFFSYAPYKGAFEPGTTPWTSWTSHKSMGTDASALGCPTDTDANGSTGIPDLLNVINNFNTSCE